MHDVQEQLWLIDFGIRKNDSGPWLADGMALQSLVGRMIAVLGNFTLVTPRGVR